MAEPAARRLSTLDLPPDRPRGIGRLLKRAMASILEEEPAPDRFDRSIYLFRSDGSRIGAPSANHMKVRDDGHLARAAGLRGTSDTDAPELDFDPATALAPEERAAIRAANEMCASDAADHLGISVRQLRRRIEAGNRKLRTAAEAAARR